MNGMARIGLQAASILFAVTPSFAGPDTKLDRDTLDLVPNVRSLWTILEIRAPTVVTNRLDIGGLEGGTPAYLSGNGASFTQTTFRLNGLDVTDPVEPGRPLVEPQPDDLESATIRAWSLPARIAGPGMEVDMLSRRRAAGRGRAELFYTDGGLQGENALHEQARRGVFGDRYADNWDGHFHVGGEESGGWFSGFTTRLYGKRIAGFGPQDRRALHSGAATATRELGTAGRLTFVGLGQIETDDHRGAGAPPGSRTPEATGNARDSRVAFQAILEKHPDPDVYDTFALGWARAGRRTLLHPGTGQAARDLITGSRSGADDLRRDGAGQRLVALVERERIVEGAGRHVLTGGSEAHLGLGSDFLHARDSVTLFYASGTPAAVGILAGAKENRETLLLWRLRAQDDWSLTDRLTLTGGLIGEILRQPLPWGKSATFLGGAPRIQAAYRVGSERSPLVLRAGAAQYLHAIPARTRGFQVADGMTGDVYAWKDLNGDGRYQAGEEGKILKRFGPDLVEVDPDVRRPKTDEVSVGLEKWFGQAVRVELAGFARRERDRIGLVNVGVPDGSYRPVSVVDPGNDLLPGEYNTVLLWDQDPATLGKDRYRLTNPVGPDPFAGFAVVTFDIHPISWATIGGAFTSHAVQALTGPSNDPLDRDADVLGITWDNPNNRTSAEARTSYDRAFTAKAWGIVKAPWGSRAGVVARYWDGRPFARRNWVNLTQGPVLYIPNDNAHVRTTFHLTLDARLEQVLTRRGGHGEWAVVAEGYNLLNFENDTQEVDLTGPEFGPRLATALQPPRVFRLGLAYLW